MKMFKSTSLCYLVSALVYAGALFPVNTVAGTVAQTPLFLGEGNVPGNLALTPSVEYPTVTSVANLGNYDETVKSVGYFDSNKCYGYQYSATESERHFYPVSVSADYTCPGDVWSGNYLNWAATSTIDPFRWALTGGYRVKDTVTETWIEKARHTGQGSLFPTRTISGVAVVNNATPFSTSSITTYVNGEGNKMDFQLPSGHGFSNTAPGVDTPVFSDTDFGSISITQFGSGTVERSSEYSYDADGFSLKKKTNSDPNGARIKVVDSGSVDYDNFIFTGRIYRPSGGPTNGSSDRLALSDSDGNGYGFSVSGSSIKVEKRTKSGSSVSTIR
jgi:type IV pilus assembly protein PilY1